MTTKPSLLEIILPQDMANPMAIEHHEDIERLISKVKDNAQLFDEYIDLTRLLRKKKLFENAFELLQKLNIREELTKNQKARIHGELGFVLLETKNKNFGIAEFQNSLKLNRESYYVREGLYWAYLSNKQFEEAALELKTIAQKYPDRKKPLALLCSEIAEMRLLSNDLSDAKKWMDESLKQKVNLPFIEMIKIEILIKEKKFKESILLLEAIIDQYPITTFAALKKLESIYFEKKEYSRYQFSLIKVLQKNPNNGFAHFAMGTYLKKIRKPEQALNHFKQALDEDSLRLMALRETLSIYAKQKNLVTEGQAYDTILAALPTTFEMPCLKCGNPAIDSHRCSMMPPNPSPVLVASLIDLSN